MERATETRVTERDYLAALADACPPTIWRKIVARAVSDAQAGDAKAREWLARYLIGKTEPPVISLHKSAVDAASGDDPVADDLAERRRIRDLLGPFG